MEGIWHLASDIRSQMRDCPSRPQIAVSFGNVEHGAAQHRIFPQSKKLKAAIVTYADRNHGRRIAGANFEPFVLNLVKSCSAVNE